MAGYPHKAKLRVQALIESLEDVVQRDPEQEVRGMALPVLDACIADIKAALPNDPVVAKVAEVISPEAIALGEPIRAVDILLVAKQLDAAIGPRPGRTGFL